MTVKETTNTKKIIDAKTIIMAATLFAALFFLFFGCTQLGTGADTNTVKITSETDASKTVADVSTDISGISNSLNQIDAAFTDTNA